MAQAYWYVCHTYSGYENKVKANLDKTIKNRHLEDQILEVRVPTQEVLETRKSEDEDSDKVQYTEEGERIPPKPKRPAQAKLVNKKLFPGYVFVHMIMNEDNWYIVRNKQIVRSAHMYGNRSTLLHGIKITLVVRVWRIDQAKSLSENIASRHVRDMPIATRKVNSTFPRSD